GDSDAGFLGRAATALLSSADDPDWPERRGAWGILQALARQRWPWAPALARRIRKPELPERSVFTSLPKWEETAPRPSPRSIALTDAAIDERLDAMLGEGAERRTGQRAYAHAAGGAFQPRRSVNAPNMVLAEAGTGIGKTLGYLAPASGWARAAEGTVWLSTFTKALQRQLDQETRRAYPDPAEKRQKVVVRKGRENYLCLLNLEDAVQGGFANRAQVFAQLAARWAEYSRDGDMVGGDLPGWLPALFGRTSFSGLTDRRGECIYAGCPHYRSCFIERATRASAQADLVIANHALVMINAARGRAEGAAMTRLVFDEGHHLFDAADATFAVELSGREAVELRNWLLGPPTASRGRRRGLAARLSDIASYDDAAAAAIERIAVAARILPGDGWLQRVAGGSAEGPIETLLAAVRGQVLARAEGRPGTDAGYSLDTEVAEVLASVVEAAGDAAAALARIGAPMAALKAQLEALPEAAPDWLDGGGRARVDGAIAGLRLRAETIAAWTGLLARLGGAADPMFVDWFALDRIDGREFDIGIHRHWLDPMLPFARTVLEPAHGVLVTSATLRS
ncbi:MAG: ATP-dependent DNA helicase, partial [Sandarakinorhabdus sp.]|nr:ATP-dependent DNA helicase [Sandarakinorhabdus sp.]